MKILIAIPPYKKEGEDYSVTLGPLYLSSYLKSRGFDVVLKNFNHIPRHDFRKVLTAVKFDIFCTGGMSGFYTNIRNLVKLVRETRPEVKIILGGALATGAPEFIMNSLNPDFLVLGEGEITLERTIKGIMENETEYEQIKGLVFRKKNQIINNGLSPLIQNLDSIPFPDFESFGMEEYFERYSIERKDRGEICWPVLGSRGCTHNCTYCFRVFGDGSYRTRSPENIVQEMLLLQQKYGITEFTLADELLGTDKERIENLCKLIKPLNTKWICAGFRTDKADESLFHRFRNSGLQLVGFGIESGCPRILKSMKKGLAPKTVENALRMARKAGVRTAGSLIFGDPAETLETAAETFAFRRHLRGYSIELKRVMPYPGTVIFKKMVEKGIISDLRFFHEKTVLDGLNEHGEYLNMTELSDTDFRELQSMWVTEQIVCNAFGRVENVHETDENYCSLEVYCPICDQKNHYAKVNFTSWLIRVTCHLCYQEFSIHRLSIPSLRKKWEKYQKKISVLRQQSTPVIITPNLRKPMYDALYKEDLADLNIIAAMDRESKERRGLSPNLPLLLRNPENIEKFRNETKFLVLRDITWNEKMQNDIANELISAGINSKNIILAVGEFREDSWSVPPEDRFDYDEWQKQQNKLNLELNKVDVLNRI